MTEQVISDLCAQKGYSKNQAYQLLYSGGLRIHSTMDPAIQKICDSYRVSDDDKQLVRSLRRKRNGGKR